MFALVRRLLFQECFLFLRKKSALRIVRLTILVLQLVSFGMCFMFAFGISQIILVLFQLIPSQSWGIDCFSYSHLPGLSSIFLRLAF